METTVCAGVVTVIVAWPVTPVNVAVMVVEPAAIPVAKPAPFTVANAALAELHVAVAVTFCVDPSL
jgi:hypothetical protein